MDNKFLVTMVWIIGAAVVASVVYRAWDLLQWLVGRMVFGWRMVAPYLGASFARPMSARGLIRVKVRRGWR